jgi:hypothetical protein
LGISPGKTCIEGVHHADNDNADRNVEYFNFTACTLDCSNPKLNPDNACDLDKFRHGCYEDFVDRVLWKSAGALDPVGREPPDEAALWEYGAADRGAVASGEIDEAVAGKSIES